MKIISSTQSLFLAAAVTLFVSTSLQAEEEIDKEQLLRGKIIKRVYEVDSKRGIKEGQTIGWIAADRERVWDVITDYESYPEFMPYVAESAIRKRDRDAVYVYNRLGLPWPLSDIWYVDRIEEDHAAGTITWKMTEGNIAINHGSWELVSFRQGTIVYYTVFTDAGTSLPAWAQNIVTKITLPRVIKVLRKRLAVLQKNHPESGRVRY